MNMKFLAGREKGFFGLLRKQRRKHPFLLFKHFCLCALLPLAHKKKKIVRQNVSCWNSCVDQELPFVPEKMGAEKLFGAG